jgi:hypothetical protein
LPSDLIEPIVNEVIQTDIYYQNKELYYPWGLRGKKVAAGNYVTNLYSPGDVNVYPGGALYIEASDRIMLRDGFSVKYGAQAHFIADPEMYFECWNITDVASTEQSRDASLPASNKIKVISNEQIADGFDIRLFPNPATDNIQLIAGKDIMSDLNVRIYNLQGAEIMSCPLKASAGNRIDINDLTKGYYFINITDGKRSKTLPFIKL